MYTINSGGFMKIILLLSITFLVSCAGKVIVKECEIVNSGPFYICKEQNEIKD